VTHPTLAAAEIDLSPAAQALRAGHEHHAAGRLEEAIATYTHGLNAPGASSNVATTSELHAKLGNAYMLRGYLDLAGESYKAALRLSPHLAACWCNLGTIHLKSGRAQDAITLYLEALKLNPAHWASRGNLAEALMATKQHLVAKALLMELAQERPQDGEVRHRLGRACFELGATQAALEHFKAAVALNASDAESLYWIGAIRQKLGELEAARAAYVRAAQVEPLIRRAAKKSPPQFKVLALYAPFAGNTPAEYLFKDAAYDIDTLALLGADEPDVAALGDVELVVNLISDADQAEAVLPQAVRLVERLAKPVVNHPTKIRHTARDVVAALLRGIAGCRIPQIVRLVAGADASVAGLERLLPFSGPVLARPAGTHGGDDLEKIEDPDALSQFLAQRGDHDHYVIEYVDCVSPDRYFRKYRFIFVGREILPYHLAIGNHWKVHHVSTDMANQPWMQREEAAFLTDPAAVFSPDHYATLRAIKARIGLDYFGIDCALDNRRDLLVFEVNASMLVHEDNAGFPYKDPAVRAIKQAFERLLRERAVPTAAPLSP
jgi:tetratricopeptide (TPR) repeat protein